MTQIVKVTNKSGVQFYPQTHTKAVIDDNGYTAESRLGAMQDEINQAQLKVGAVPSDLTPTDGSSNWVTSGGVFNELVLDSSTEPEEIDLSQYSPVAGAINAGAKWFYTYGSSGTDVYSKFIPVIPGRTYIIAAKTSSASKYAFMTSNTVGANNTSVTTFATGYSNRANLAANTSATVRAPEDASYLWFGYTLTSPGDWSIGSLYILNTVKVKDFVKELGDKVSSLEPDLSTKRFELSLGFLSADTGSYPQKLEWYIGYRHTPKFIKCKKEITIKTLGCVGRVWFYGSGYTYLGSGARIEIDTRNATQTVSFPSNASYYRIALSSYINRDYIEIESYWDGDDYAFQPRPSNGYQPFTCEVKALKCNGLESTSSLQEQYMVTTDSGMLHLPSSYKEDGESTPLIIFVHGAGSNYTSNSTSFATANPLAPEWDAAGFAQMDVDLIPDLYNDKQNNSGGGSSDDAECIFAAYKWCIEHFNIRRDGVYLIGRSRGGQAVLQVLGKYNPSVMPIICAIDNAGANQLINYGLTNGNTAAFWNLICESYSLPTEGRPTPSGRNVILAQNNLYSFLMANIKQWFSKASVALNLCTSNTNSEKTPEAILEFIHNHPRVSSVDDIEYLTFLKNFTFRSPVPLRFDWCVEDKTQEWNANDGIGNYSSIVKDGFVNNPSGNSVYREWPTVDSTTPSVSGATDRGHWHELYNLYDDDYTLPNGAVVTNPSMARVEWLLWCMSHDSRFN